ncbi:MAG: cold shock domain-containing protein [Chitinophagaceae bacterium]|nr:cold shock domain-containing protein [Chitinophagaceae bacterium]
MAESFSKKEKQKKRMQAKQDKQLKMQERKTNNNKGKPLEEMFAYIDEYGNLSSSPPGTKPKASETKERLLPYQQDDTDTRFQGTVAFFIEAKGYGFITQDGTRENIFVHANQLKQPIKEKDLVTFEKEKTPKGYSAINVIKINS